MRCSTTCLFYTITHLFQFIVASVSTFVKQLQVSNSKLRKIESLDFNIWLQSNICFKWFLNHWFFFFFKHFTQHPNLFLYLWLQGIWLWFLVAFSILKNSTNNVEQNSAKINKDMTYVQAGRWRKKNKIQKTELYTKQNLLHKFTGFSFWTEAH